jgi:hypothetical protein
LGEGKGERKEDKGAIIGGRVKKSIWGRGWLLLLR